jgi:hypothetical protein
MQFTDITLPRNVNIVPLANLKDTSPPGLFNVSILPDSKSAIAGISPEVIDYRVQYTFRRRVPDIMHPGKTKIKTHVEDYYLSYAYNEGLVKDKGAWVKMPNIMCRKSCILRGSTVIASDIKLGLYSHIEMGLSDDDGEHID